MKTFFFTVTLTCLFALPALAQNSGAVTQVGPNSAATGPVKAIGPAPANSPQKQVLDSALSSQTRQTLQEAMNSYHAPDASHPAPSAK
jgi:hypothetical protein